MRAAAGSVLLRWSGVSRSCSHNLARSHDADGDGARDDAGSHPASADSDSDAGQYPLALSQGPESGEWEKAARRRVTAGFP